LAVAVGGEMGPQSASGSGVATSGRERQRAGGGLLASQEGAELGDDAHS